MPEKQITLAFATAILMAMFVAAPHAQEQAVRVRGTIDSINGDVMQVTTREQTKVALKLLPDARVTYPTAVPLRAINANDYVGVAWMKGSDGIARAIEVLVFPPAQRGAGDGQRSWDLTPDSVMTNATVATAAASPNGPVLKLTHKDGVTEITVPDDAPVWTPAVGDRSLLKPGAYVVLFGRKQADGVINVPSISVEKDGFKPPN